MAQIPNLTQLYANIANDLRSKLNLSDNELKTVLDVFAGVISAQFKLTYLFLSDIQENVFPDTADTFENEGTLDRQGQIYLGRQRRPATSGLFNIQLTGDIGSTLRKDITFKANDDSLNPGQIYVLDAEYILSGSSIVEIRALEGGTGSLLDVGDTLTLTEPVIGVERVVTITEVTTEPLAEETVEAYRQAILDSIQLEPQGGSRTDFRLWASDAQGVRKVYPYVKENGAGTVQVYVEATTDDSSDGNGTPTTAILTAVTEVINLDPDDTLDINERGRIPIQATLEVLPIVITPVDVTVTGLNENSTEIQTSIENNVQEYLLSVRPYVAGADLARDKNDVLYSARIQSIVTDTINNDNFFQDIDVFVNGNAQTSFLFSRENIPYLRNLTFN